MATMSRDGFLTRSLEFIKNFAMDTYEEAQWQDTQLIDLINSANHEVFEELVSVSDPKAHFLLAEEALTIVADKDEYQWPNDMRKFISLVKEDASGNDQYEITMSDPASRLAGINVTANGFKIVPMPKSGESGWKVKYIPRPPLFLWEGLHHATDSPIGSTLNMSSAVTHGTFADQTNFYKNTFVRIVDGTQHSGDVFRITANTVAGYTTAGVVDLTVAPALTTAITGTPAMEIMPCVQIPFDKAIMWRVVMTMKASDADQRHYITAEREYHSIMRQLMNRWADVQGRHGPSMTDDYLEAWDYGGIGAY
jgi:hypothetical protein